MTDGIYLGDAYELIKKIPDKSIDLIVTGPPYDFKGICGIFKDAKATRAKTYTDILDKNLNKSIDLSILNEFCRVLKRINLYIWCNKEQIKGYLDYFLAKDCLFDIIIWAKVNPIPFLSRNYLKDKEYCLFFKEKGVPLHITYETGKTVYLSQKNVEDRKKYDHPTIKPINIIKNLIENSSNEGDIVLDPFCGSGTTCVAAKELGRHYIGFEIDEEYYTISCDRLDGVTQREKETGYSQISLF